MLVSIITVSYNSQQTIARTIESVLAQTYAPIEYIIVDGASTDNTLEIVRSYQAKFEASAGKTLRIISEKDNEINDWKTKFEKLSNEFKLFKERIQNKIYSLTSKIFEILHIPYSWYEANDIDYAIDTTRDYLKKHSKTKDDLER